MEFGGGRSGWRFHWALATLVIAVTYAGLDEWHQSFVPVRPSQRPVMSRLTLWVRCCAGSGLGLCQLEALHRAAISLGKDLR